MSSTLQVLDQAEEVKNHSLCSLQQYNEGNVLSMLEVRLSVRLWQLQLWANSTVFPAVFGTVMRVFSQLCDPWLRGEEGGVKVGGGCTAAQSTSKLPFCDIIMMSLPAVCWQVALGWRSALSFSNGSVFCCYSGAHSDPVSHPTLRWWQAGRISGAIYWKLGLKNDLRWSNIWNTWWF